MAFRLVEAEETPVSRRIAEALIDSFEFIVETSHADRAGTDARVTFDIGGYKHIVDGGGERFEKGTVAYVRFSFLQEFGRTIDLSELRRSLIAISHDNRGRKPGWRVDRVFLSFSFDLANSRDSNGGVILLPIDPTATSTQRSLRYKVWSKLGWLEAPSAGVTLQAGFAPHEIEPPSEPHDSEPGVRCWCGAVHRPIPHHPH